MRNKNTKEIIKRQISVIGCQPDCYTQYDLEGYVLTPDGIVLVEQFDYKSDDPRLYLTFMYKGVMYERVIYSLHNEDQIYKLITKFVKEVIRKN